MLKANTTFKRPNLLTRVCHKIVNLCGVMHTAESTWSNISAVSKPNSNFFYPVWRIPDGNESWKNISRKSRADWLFRIVLDTPDIPEVGDFDTPDIPEVEYLHEGGARTHGVDVRDLGDGGDRGRQSRVMSTAHSSSYKNKKKRFKIKINRINKQKLKFFWKRQERYAKEKSVIEFMKRI